MHWKQLRRPACEAARQAFSELRAAHPDEHFYAYALYTDEGLMTLLPAANSDEAWQRKIATANVSPSLADHYRWTTGEWAYESFGDSHFQPVRQLLNAVIHEDGAIAAEDTHLTDADLEDDPEYAALQQQVLASMTGALQDLDAEGFFGHGEARQQVTLFVTMSDTEESRRIEDTSAAALNPAAVVQRFAARRN